MNNKLKNKQMKRVLSITLIMGVLALASCSSNKEKKQTDADKKFGKLKVEIPESLKDKPEIVSYINETARLADEYALLIDKVVEEAGEYKGVEEEDLGMMDKIKLTKIASEVGLKSLEIMGRWAQCTEKHISIQETLTEEEAKAFEEVFKHFEKRMEQVEERHSDFFNKK